MGVWMLSSGHDGRIKGDITSGRKIIKVFEERL